MATTCSLSFSILKKKKKCCWDTFDDEGVKRSYVSRSSVCLVSLEVHGAHVCFTKPHGVRARDIKCVRAKVLTTNWNGSTPETSDRKGFILAG